jgi:hypothetical protein
VGDLPSLAFRFAFIADWSGTPTLPGSTQSDSARDFRSPFSMIDLLGGRFEERSTSRH